MMQEPLFGAFLHHFSTNSRQFRKGKNWRRTSHIPSFVVNSNHLLVSPALFCNQCSHEADGNQQRKKCNYVIEMSRDILNVVQIFYTNKGNYQKHNCKNKLAAWQGNNLFHNRNPLWNNRLLLFSISKTECCAKKRLQNQNRNKSADNACNFLLVCRNRIPVHPNYRKFGKKA